MIPSLAALARLLLALACVAAVAAATAHAGRHDRHARESPGPSPYIVATFQVTGGAWVHVDELRASRRATPDHGERSVQAVKRLIRESAPRASGATSDVTDDQIVLTGLWAFDATPDAAVEARSRACRLEAEGYRPWIASACGRTARPAPPRDARVTASVAETAREPRPLEPPVAATDPTVAPATRGTDVPSATAPARTTARRGRAPIVDLGSLWRHVLPFLPLFVLILVLGRLRRALSWVFGLPFRILAPRLAPLARRRARRWDGSAEAKAAREDAATRRAGRVAHLPLRQILRSEILLERLGRVPAAGVKSDEAARAEPVARRAVPAAWVARYGEALRRASTETNLSAEVMATVVLAEQRGMPTTIPVDTALTSDTAGLARGLQAAINGMCPGDDARLLVFASELVARGTTHALAFFDEYVSAPVPASAIREIVLDTAARQLPDELPLGLGQRDVASLVDLGIHRDPRLVTEWKLDGLADRALRRELRRRLLDEADNVRLCAKVVRRLADMAAELGRRRPDLARKALDVASVPPTDVDANRLLTFVRDSCEGSLDLSRFAHHPDDWTPGHMSFIGWRYHARHLGATDTMHGEPGWAAPYLAAFVDIARAKILG